MSSRHGGAKKQRKNGGQVIADNRKARYAYFITDPLEAGIQLTGTEVKSLRMGQASLNEAYAQAREGEIYLLNANIPEYKQASRFNHEPGRPRKLLMHGREIARYSAAVQRKGMTIVPLRLYFTETGLVKLEVGLGQGKKQADKRQTEKDRSWSREKARLMRDKG